MTCTKKHLLRIHLAIFSLLLLSSMITAKMRKVKKPMIWKVADEEAGHVVQFIDSLPSLHEAWLYPQHRIKLGLVVMF